MRFSIFTFMLFSSFSCRTNMSAVRAVAPVHCEFSRLIRSDNEKELNDFLKNQDHNDPNMQYDKALIYAAAEGKINATRVLLKHPSISGFNYAFIEAAENGRKEVVELLIKDQRVNPAEEENLAFISAATGDHYEIVEILLKDKRVNPGAQDNQAFISAAMLGHDKIVERLMRESKVNPADQRNNAIILAAMQGQSTVIEKLLRDPRVNPADQGNKTIIMAAQNGHDNIIQRLLRDQRVNPADQNNEALRMAREDGRTSTAQILLSDSRVAALERSAPQQALNPARYSPKPGGKPSKITEGDLNRAAIMFQNNGMSGYTKDQMIGRIQEELGGTAKKAETIWEKIIEQEDFDYNKLY